MKNIIASLILILMLCSCGTRKVETTRILQNKDSLSIDNSVIFENNINWSFTPIDSLKPFKIAGKEYQNVKIQKSIQNKKTIYDKKTITKTVNVTKSKQTEKSDYTFLLSLIALFICGFIFLYFYLPKLKV